MAFDFACPDWFDRLRAGRTPIADLPLDQRAADEAVGIFDYLRVPDVPGQPLFEDAAGDWLRDIVRACLGSVDRKTGERRVGEAFILVPKKNSKTTGGAAIALTFMLLNKRRNADLLIIGPTQKIAETAFKQAKGIIEADPEGFLKERFHVRDHLNVIEDRVTGARLMIRTFGMDVLTGCKPVFCLIDEIHILGSVPYAADVIRQIRGGMLPFPEALLVMITTQSDHPPAGVFRSELAYARKVRDGGLEGEARDSVRLLPVLYEFPEALQTDDDKPWLDPDLWHLVNPNIGLSITVKGLKALRARAEEDGPQEVIAWATQHLNVEVGLALHAARWIGADFWMDAAEPGLTLDEILATSDVVTVGIDGGGLDDLFGLGVIGRHRDTRKWRHWGKAWAQPEALDKRKENATRLIDLAREGELTICHDQQDDITEAVEIVVRIHEAGLLPGERGIGLDPLGIGALVDALVDEGIPQETMVAVRQGVGLSPAIWTLERKLKDGTFGHCDQKLMAWSVGNAKAEQRGNAIYISKQAAGKAKIDPLIALFNAAELMSRNPVAASAGVVIPDEIREAMMEALG